MQDTLTTFSCATTKRIPTSSSLQQYLRVAVAKLRQAFGDDADDPRYIETLPRRGYRWLFPVTVHDTQPNLVGPNTAEAEIGEADPRNYAAQPQGGESDVSTTAISPKPSRRTILIRRAIVSVALCAVVLAAVRFLRPQPVAPESKVLPLTTYPGLEYMPSLSPDGNWVVFGWTGLNPSDPYGVYIKQVDHDRARRVTDTPAGAADSDPVWTPDGRSVIFFRRAELLSGIYIAPAQGGPARQLATVSLAAQRIRRARFDVSPQGNTIVYPDARAADDRIVSARPPKPCSRIS